MLQDGKSKKYNLQRNFRSLNPMSKRAMRGYEKQTCSRNTVELQVLQKRTTSNSNEFASSFG